ncbi:MAG: alpha-1,6-mannosyltransferase [Verrucomicrobiales bacterium]
MNFTRPISISILLAGHVLILLAVSSETLRPLLPFGAAIAVSGAFLAWKCGINSLFVILGIALVLRLSCLGIEDGTLSDDVYRYLWDGEIVTAGSNPFEETPRALNERGVGDPELFAKLNSPDYFSVYPPVSQGLFALAAFTEFPQLAIRLLLGISEFAALLLLARIVQPRLLILYAWNPLVVLETWGQAHTEAALLAVFALMLFCLRKRRFSAATAALTLAVWIKLWPILFLPFLLRHNGWRIRDAAVFIGLSVAVWLPFQPWSSALNMLQSLRLYVDTFEFNAGPYYLLKWITSAFVYGLDFIPDRDPRLFIGIIVRIAMLFSLAWFFLRRRGWSIERQLAIVSVIVLLSLPTIHPWYFLPVFLVFPFIDRIEWAWIWLGVCSAGTYLLYTHGLAIYWVFVGVGWIGWALLKIREGIADKPEP